MPNNNLISKRSKEISDFESNLNKKQSILLEAERKLILQKQELLRKTKVDPLTLKLQDKLSKTFGAGRVQLEFKKINQSKKEARERILSDFSRAITELSKKKIKLGTERSKLKLVKQRFAKRKKLKIRVLTIKRKLKFKKVKVIKKPKRTRKKLKSTRLNPSSFMVDTFFRL